MSKAAFSEADRLGHSWVGPEHGLLAILRGDPADTARIAVEEAGLDAERFERWYVESVDRSDPKPSRDPDRGGISPNPAWYSVAGRAEGLAAGVGVSDVRPVDLLLALLWDTREWLPVSGLGVSREEVAASLGRSGVYPPSHPTAGPGPAVAEPCAGGLPYERPRGRRRGAQATPPSRIGGAMGHQPRRSRTGLGLRGRRHRPTGHSRPGRSERRRLTPPLAPTGIAPCGTCKLLRPACSIRGNRRRCDGPRRQRGSDNRRCGPEDFPGRIVNTASAGGFRPSTQWHRVDTLVAAWCRSGRTLASAVAERRSVIATEPEAGGKQQGTGGRRQQRHS